MNILFILLAVNFKVFMALFAVITVATAGLFGGGLGGGIGGFGGKNPWGGGLGGAPPGFGGPGFGGPGFGGQGFGGPSFAGWGGGPSWGWGWPAGSSSPGGRYYYDDDYLYLEELDYRPRYRSSRRRPLRRGRGRRLRPVADKGRGWGKDSGHASDNGADSSDSDSD